MLKHFLYTACLSFIAWTTLSAETSIQQALQQRVDRELNQAIIVGISSPQGQRFISAGSYAQDDPRKVNEHTLFEIGGITKLFTATATSDLIIQHKLRWKTPVATLLPPEAQGEGWRKAGINIHMLATHSSGLPSHPINLNSSNPQNPFAEYDVDMLYKGLQQSPLTYRPGHFYRYSELGYGILGHILERRTGQTYEQVVETHVTRPLGMRDTTITLNQQQQRRLAPGHQGISTTTPTTFNALTGAGGLHSNAQDLLRFLKAQMGQLKTSKTPAISTTQAQLMPTGGKDSMVGYAWQISLVDGEPVYWHNGQTQGYSAFVGFNPSRQIGVVVLSNSSQPIDEIGFHALNPNAFPIDKLPRLPKLEPKQLDRYVGTYQISPQADITISRQHDRLYAQFSNMPKYRIYPINKKRFGFANGQLVLNFNLAGKQTQAPSVKIEDKLKSYTAKRKG